MTLILTLPLTPTLTPTLNPNQGEYFLWEDLSVRCGYECISGGCTPGSEAARWVPWMAFALCGALVYTVGMVRVRVRVRVGLGLG